MDMTNRILHSFGEDQTLSNYWSDVQGNKLKSIDDSVTDDKIVDDKLVNKIMLEGIKRFIQDMEDVKLEDIRLIEKFGRNIEERNTYITINIITGEQEVVKVERKLSLYKYYSSIWWTGIALTVLFTTLGLTGSLAPLPAFGGVAMSAAGSILTYFEWKDRCKA